MNRQHEGDKNLHINGIHLQSGDEDGEIIPLISSEDEKQMRGEDLPDNLPILPVKNAVLFPGVVMPITVGRKKSIKLVKEAYKGDRTIGVVSQSNENEEPTSDDLFEMGTVAHILKRLILPDGSITIIIQGRRRFKIKEITQDTPYMRAAIDAVPEMPMDAEDEETAALIQSIKDTAKRILKLNPDIPQEASIALANIESSGFLIHFLSSNVQSDVATKQKILEAVTDLEAGTLLLQALLQEVHMLQLKHEIQSKVHSDIDQQQRDYYLRSQIKVLQEELGHESSEQELEKLIARAAELPWPESTAKHFKKEVEKLRRMNPAAAEYPVAMNYVEFLVELPWGTYTEDNFDLKNAQKTLDSDHHGLDKVKERIIEYLAVLKLKQNMKAPILCLYGPPGVGKTSLGKSVSKALGREYVRMSLGGVHDEAEIRGHRKTYIGAMPGKIIQNLKKANSSNPVFILDEIDKVGRDFRGDPGSALLEVLDPEQNTSFVDNYLEVEYDLSKVMFIATCNNLETIHPALRDRMEIIEINGYTQEEKARIAKKHLLPKQLEEHGLPEDAFKITPKGMEKILDHYTRESGVRSLERTIGALARKIARRVAMEEVYITSMGPKEIRELLGPERFDRDLYQDIDIPGVVPGLAWTSVGGEILFVEVSLSRGKGKLTLSGQLGDVMKESATAALSYLKAHNHELDLDYRLFDQFDVHVHIPAGAVPKDGPSAGITMLTALASAFTQHNVRAKVAMTGEITLRGQVLPVGGIKEKVLAAKRAGIKELIMCHKNEKDVDEIEKDALKGLKFHYVEQVSEVLKHALGDLTDKPQDLHIIAGPGQPVATA